VGKTEKTGKKWENGGKYLIFSIKKFILPTSRIEGRNALKN
jgi:hypothetical protein